MKFPRFTPLLVVAALAIAPLKGSAQTISEARITEFLSSNQDGLEDSDGDASDWIEIWNASGVAGDLGGWHLTDDPANLTKWTFPTGTEIEGGEYLVVFASAKNLIDPTAELHTNFKIQSSAGGYLALVKPDGTSIATEFDNYPDQFEDIAYGSGFPTPQDLTLLDTGAAAKWLVPSGPVTDWNQPSFDDTSWTSATTGIGYDNVTGSYVAHFGTGYLELGTAMRGTNPTAYIRIPFEVTDPVGITDIILSAQWEDGFIAYLNGTEIHRERAPAAPAWNSTSFPNTDRSPESDAVTFFEYPLSSGSLVPGTNWLTVQGLNKSAGSSDFLFSPRLTATQQDTVNLITGFFPESTPGAENTTRFDGITADTKFSTDRGTFTAPFELSITSATPGVTVHYTTDGSPPSETTGTVYAGPLTISSTTVIRAMAFKAGFRPTNIDTHTYLFPADVVNQPEMDTSITQDSVYGPQMVDALTAIPTISLSFDGTDIDRTEIPISVELLNFESGTKQIDAGAARFGSFVTNFHKRSFRLHFRSIYGSSRLEFPLFEETDYVIPPTNDFDSLDVRAGNHDMIARGAYLSNRFTDDTMLEMGNISPHGRFVHIYFNGLYHGQYHLRERWDAAMAADYLPGKEEEFDTLNVNNSSREFGAPNLQEIQDGDLTDWIALRNLIDNSPTPFSDTKDMLDVANLIDFMLIWMMGDSESEFRAAGSLENDVTFKFFIKDADGYLRPPNNTHHGVTHNGPLNAMTAFRNEADPDFMTLLADRIHLHFFNSGALTPERKTARLQHRLDEISVSFIAEVARRRFITTPTSSVTNHSPAGLLAYHQNVINNQFPTVTEDRLNRLRLAGMYPDIIAPVLSQFGGSIPAGGAITMSTGATKIYYTLDGSDPRLPGGAISPNAIEAPFENDPPEPQDYILSGANWKYLDDGSDQGTNWRTVAFDDSAWASGPSELGYGDQNNEATVVSFVDLDPVASGSQRNATTYFRHKVNIDSPASFTHFSLNLRYDDGAAIYINGTEQVRTSNLPTNATFDTYATSGTPSENNYYEFIIPTSAFVDGENTFAVEMHNSSPGSSDISFDLRLSSVVDTSSGSNTTTPITLSQAAHLNARAYNPDVLEWSALTSTFFSINSTPAAVDNLAISEIHYHPAEPTTAAELAISADRDDYEFVELLNISTQSIDLTGVNFSDGISYAFTDNTILEPGDRAVLVRDIDAFTARYGAGIQIAGEYSGRLSNGGEPLALSLTGTGTLRSLDYNDVAPWPSLPDGGGYSLVLRNPTSNPDHSLPANWGTHAVIGGAPGSSDSLQIGGYDSWKITNNVTSDDEDNDGDNIPALIEYALGTSPLTPSNAALPELGSVTTVGADQFQTITYEKNPAATDLTYQLQSSTDLASWQDETAIIVGSNTYRIGTPISNGVRQYLRLKVSIN